MLHHTVGDPSASLPAGTGEAEEEGEAISNRTGALERGVTSAEGLPQCAHMVGTERAPHHYWSPPTTTHSQKYSSLHVCHGLLSARGGVLPSREGLTLSVLRMTELRARERESEIEMREIGREPGCAESSRIITRSLRRKFAARSNRPCPVLCLCRILCAGYCEVQLLLLP
jgi:hypothetical protein